MSQPLFFGLPTIRRGGCLTVLGISLVQNAMARCMARMAERQDEFEGKRKAWIEAQMRGEGDTRDMKAAIAELPRTVDRFLRTRAKRQRQLSPPR